MGVAWLNRTFLRQKRIARYQQFAGKAKRKTATPNWLLILPSWEHTIICWSIFLFCDADLTTARLFIRSVFATTVWSVSSRCVIGIWIFIYVKQTSRIRLPSIGSCGLSGVECQSRFPYHWDGASPNFATRHNFNHGARCCRNFFERGRIWQCSSITKITK